MPWFKRGYRGLYGNKMTRFGNKVSFAENKTRRTWKPNVQKKTLFSETLQRKLTFRMTTSVIRTVKRFGGIDEYLVRTRDSEIKYDKAILLKQEILAIREGQTQNSPEEGEKITPVKEPTPMNNSKVPLRASPVVKFCSRGLLDLL